MKSPRNFGSGGYGKASAGDYPSIGFSTPNSTSAMRSVTTILKAWAARNAHQEIAVLPGNDILEARIEPHADEGQREEYRREHFGDTRLGKFTLGIGREEAVSLQ